MFLAGTLPAVVISRYFVPVGGFKQYHLGAASNIELQREMGSYMSGFHRPTAKKTTFRIQAAGGWILLQQLSHSMIRLTECRTQSVIAALLSSTAL